MSRVPFIPKWLDDAGLTPIQFRILAHLYRRSGKMLRCWPGAASIRRACGVSDDALWPAIRELEKRGLVRRQKRRYNANEYVLIVPGVTPENRVTLSPQETGEQSPQETGQRLPVETGEQLPGKPGHKGLEREVPPRNDEMKGGAERPAPALISFPWSAPTDLPPDLRAKLGAAYPNADDQADVFAVIRGRELTYRAKRTADEWPAVFLAAVDREDKADARNTSSRSAGWDTGHRRRKIAPEADGWSEPGEKPRPPAPSDEPAGWQEWLDLHQPGTAHAAGGIRWCSWQQKSPAEREAIKRLIATEGSRAA